MAEASDTRYFANRYVNWIWDLGRILPDGRCESHSTKDGEWKVVKHWNLALAEKAVAKGDWFWAEAPADGI